MLAWLRSHPADARDSLLEFSLPGAHRGLRGVRQPIRPADTVPEEVTGPEQLRLHPIPAPEGERAADGRGGAAGSVVRTQMNTQHSTEEKSLDKVVALIPRWKRLADKWPWPRISWTGTWSGGPAIRASCGPNTPTCQLRFGWKWRWRLSISSACPWLRSYWWFTMCFSGHPTRSITSPAPRHPTAPSARRGLDDYKARMHTHHLHTLCRWLPAPDMRLQQGWMGEDGAQRGKTASRVWDADWGQRGQVLPGWIGVPHAGYRWGGGDGCFFSFIQTPSPEGFSYFSIFLSQLHRPSKC